VLVVVVVGVVDEVDVVVGGVLATSFEACVCACVVAPVASADGRSL